MEKEKINESNCEFTPNENYPESAPVPQRGDILSQLELFGINAAGEIKLIDSTHDEADIRLNYMIDKNGCCASATLPDG